MVRVNPVATSQGSLEPLTPVEGPDAWYAADWETNKEWIYHLTEEDKLELSAAVSAAHKLKGKIQDITKEDFPLPNLGKVLDKIQLDVEKGRGFALIKGFPVDKFTREETIIGYWGLGLYWGKAVSQNKKGHLVGHIKDIGHDPANPLTRLYATSVAQPWHNDSSDIVTLLCLKPAKEGGLSSWSSSISVYNEILKSNPELIPVMAGDWFMDRKGEVPEGKKPYFRIPIFNFYEGYLSVNFSDNYYHLSQRHEDVPRLTDAHLKAIAKFNEYAASKELRMDYYLEPGDIQVLNNHTNLHTRSGFVDFEDYNERRHLLRLWLSTSNGRPLPKDYEDLLGGSVEIGHRGGIRIDGFKENVPLEAE